MAVVCQTYHAPLLAVAEHGQTAGLDGVHGPAGAPVLVKSGLHERPRLVKDHVVPRVARGRHRPVAKLVAEPQPRKGLEEVIVPLIRRLGFTHGPERVSEVRKLSQQRVGLGAVADHCSQPRDFHAAGPQRLPADEAGPARHEPAGVRQGCLGARTPRRPVGHPGEQELAVVQRLRVVQAGIGQKVQALAPLEPREGEAAVQVAHGDGIVGDNGEGAAVLVGQHVEHAVDAVAGVRAARQHGGAQGGKQAARDLLAKLAHAAHGEQGRGVALEIGNDVRVVVDLLGAEPEGDVLEGLPRHDGGAALHDGGAGPREEDLLPDPHAAEPRAQHEAHEPRPAGVDPHGARRGRPAQVQQRLVEVARHGERRAAVDGRGEGLGGRAPDVREGFIVRERGGVVERVRMQMDREGVGWPGQMMIGGMPTL
ncbi:hypothetical protein EV126DRAFT_441071 [Verticillium dahliae]|nr:hypothetical protein EV126DRAFT_441071 [Verticillium dahliae]